MKGSMSTDLGIITIDPEVIAKYAGSVAVECFGIVGRGAQRAEEDQLCLDQAGRGRRGAPRCGIQADPAGRSGKPHGYDPDGGERRGRRGAL